MTAKDAIKLIHESLILFKEKDDLFKNIYNFISPIYNTNFFQDCIVTLDNILKKGNGLENGFNQFIKYFTDETTNKLRIALIELFEMEKEARIFLRKIIFYNNEKNCTGIFIFNFMGSLMNVFQINGLNERCLNLFHLQSNLQTKTYNYIFLCLHFRKISNNLFYYRLFSNQVD